VDVQFVQHRNINSQRAFARKASGNSTIQRKGVPVLSSIARTDYLIYVSREFAAFERPGEKGVMRRKKVNLVDVAVIAGAVAARDVGDVHPRGF
jgi:hypothetical protein